MFNFIASIIVCGLAVILIIVCMVYLIRKIVLRTAENDDKAMLVVLIVPLLVFTFYFIMYCIDIPSALNGGVTVYTNELPRCEYYMRSLRTVSDNPELNHLQGFKPDKYEKYGNYCIRYTKLNRIVLEIEKLD